MKKNVSAPMTEEETGEHTKKLASYDVVNTSVIKYSRDIYNGKLRLSNDALNYEVTVKPKDYNNDDITLQGKHASKYMP